MRLFVGLQPSPAFREALSELQERLRLVGVEGRYVTPDNLHLTLAFIGEWPVHVTENLPSIAEPFIKRMLIAGISIINHYFKLHVIMLRRRPP
ncbi:MAG: hypothetical protein IK099_16045 [Clostridia bacterium]|nr:hypothetical protein [Clostridia bacterium]